jgi:putative ABC transport system substrate-binding protein
MLVVRRRNFITLLGGAAVWPLVARAQRAQRVYRVGYLEGSSEARTSSLFAAFRQELQELGYIEGRDLVLYSRFADGKLDRFSSLAKELVDLNPDVLFVVTTAATRAAQAATATIPIVFIGLAIQSVPGLSPAWHGREGTPPALPTSRSNSLESVWSY